MAVVEFLLVTGGVMGLLWVTGLFLVMGVEHLGLGLLVELGTGVVGSGLTFFLTVLLFLKTGLTRRGVAKWLKEPAPE